VWRRLSRGLLLAQARPMVLSELMRRRAEKLGKTGVRPGDVFRLEPGEAHGIISRSSAQPPCFGALSVG